jgi:hypothetical protein
LLGSLAGRQAAPAPAAAEIVHEQLVPGLGGASITVRRVERPFGQLEAGIMADARRQASDVRLPTIPHACRVGGLLVPRRFGRVCVAPGSTLAFLALRRLFPALEGWSPLPGDDETGPRHVRNPDEARYELAQSILALDLAGELPSELLAEAALYGVPCVGPGGEPLETARALLTDPALTAQVTAAARRRQARLHELDEEELAASLGRARKALLGAPSELEAAR